jgi:23S rRNA (uridine2552-2'-O)-methyltransferase
MYLGFGRRFFCGQLARLRRYVWLQGIDLCALGRRPVEDQQLADMLNQPGVKRSANFGSHFAAGGAIIGKHPDLDQFVSDQLCVDGGQNRIGQAVVADHHNRSQMMGMRLEIAALQSSKFSHMRIIAAPCPQEPQTMVTSKKKNRFSANWLADHINDPYVKMATQQGYRARAAFKLTEILDQFKLLKPGARVVDLGSTPGSWSQVLRERLKVTRAAGDKAAGDGTIGNNRIIALDLLPMEPVADVTFIQGDFREDDVLARLEALLQGHKIDLVLSDMAPNLSGVAAADAARISHLNEIAMTFAQAHLKPGGALVVKSFHGSGFSQTVKAFKGVFLAVNEFKPKASRDASSETFLVARGLKSTMSDATSVKD